MDDATRWQLAIERVLQPFARLVGVAGAAALPHLERLTAAVRVPRWLLDDLVCELEDLLRDEWPSVASSSLTVRVAGGSSANALAQPQRYRAIRRCTGGGDGATATAVVSDSPRPGDATYGFWIAAGLAPLLAGYGHNSAAAAAGDTEAVGGAPALPPPPRSTSPDPVPADVALTGGARFVVAEVSPTLTELTLTVYGASRAVHDRLAMLFTQLVRSHGGTSLCKRVCVTPWVGGGQAAWIALRGHLLAALVHYKLGIFRHHMQPPPLPMAVGPARRGSMPVSGSTAAAAGTTMRVHRMA
jgi:hypothetical protein